MTAARTGRLAPALRSCALVAAVGAFGNVGCDARDIVATTNSAGAAGYCQGSGPPILLGDGVTVGEGDGNPDDICTGTVAVQTFDRALCTCQDYATSTTLDTDSFDSAAGPYVPGGTAGDVGIDGGLRTNAVVHIGGALAVAGTAGAALQADLHVAHDLDIGGPLGTGVTVSAGGDAQIAGNIDLAALMVTGTLTTPASATIAGTVTAGATARSAVNVAPPCACGASDLVDVAAFIASHVNDNQDAMIGLAPGQLTGYHGDVALDLPCGIYYTGAIRGDGALTLRVTGRVALLVDGDLSLTAPFTVELATDDAELDLMIGGLLSSDHAITVGRADHPARTRLYVAGAGTINLAGDSQLAANFYAPRASIELSGGATVFGSLFVGRIDQAAPVTIHYDIDVQRADVGCPLM